MKKKKIIGFCVLMFLIGCLFSGTFTCTPLCLSASGSGGAAKTSRAYIPQITTRAQSGKPFKVYLSPSCQTWNPYCDGSGSEEYHMRQIAVAMQPYLKQYGIESVLAAPQTGTYRNQKATITARAKQASDTNCNLYLSIHSNARDGGPKTNGTLILYPSNGTQSLRFAQILQGNFMYPDRNAIDFNTKDELWEMYMPKMPHCLIETAYHDNTQDVQWLKNNTDKIARNLAYCIALYANVPTGTVQM